MFKLQSPSNYSPLDAVHLSRCFFRCSKQFLNLSIFMPFSVSAVFCFTSSTSSKCFPLKTFFIWGNTQKVSEGEIRSMGRAGHGGHATFGPEPPSTQHGVGRCAGQSPAMKWANALTESAKNCTEAERSLSQQRQQVP